MREHADHNLPLTPLSFQILVAVADRPLHGYGIVKEIERAAGAPLRSSTGTLYLAIDRLVGEGLLEEVPSAHARRRNYRLSDLGRATAEAEARRLARLLGVAAGKRLVAPAKLEALVRAPSEAGS